MQNLEALELAGVLPDAATFEREILVRLRRDIGCDVAFFVAPGGRPTTLGIDAEKLARGIAERRYDADLAPLKLAAEAQGGVVVDTEVLGESGARRTRYHRELAAPVRGKSSLLAIGVLRGAPVGTIMLGRTGAAFGDREVAHMRRLLSTIAIARASYGLSHVPRPLPKRPGGAFAREGRISVRDERGFREMVYDAGRRDFVWTRARVDAPDVSGFPYTDVSLLAVARARRAENALLLGVGGGTLAHGLARLRPGIAIDVVDPDARVVALARAHFALDDVPRCRAHVASGIPFLEAAAERGWDIVIVDAYDGDDLADGFAEERCFRAVRRALRQGGAAAVNVVGSLAGPGPVRVVVRAAEHHLDRVAIVPIAALDERTYGGTERNVVVVGSRDD